MLVLGITTKKNTPGEKFGSIYQLQFLNVLNYEQEIQ